MSWAAVLPGALRAHACGPRWKRGGATAEEASSAAEAALGTRSWVSQSCSGAPALASPLAATLWSCPASPSVAPAPPPPSPASPPLNPRSHPPSTSHTNRFAYLSHAGPRLPVRPIPPRSWSAAAEDKGVSRVAALSRASSTTRRSA